MADLLPRPDHVFEANFFNAENGPVWSNLTDYVELTEGLKTGRRRQTVFDQVAPATFDAFLDNSGGVFNTDREDSPFYGKVNLDVPVRFRIRWPNAVGAQAVTRNRLSAAQSLGSDATEFDSDMGFLDVDSAASLQWVDDTDPSITFGGTWTAANASGYPGTDGYFNATDHSSTAASATASYTFTGTYVAWYGFKGPNHGIGKVAIDGGTQVTVDTYAATGAVGKLWEVNGLTPGTHTITVTSTGTKNTLSSATWVDVDAIVYGTAVSPPSGQTGDIIWETGVLDQTGVGFLTGVNESSMPADVPIYVKPNTAYSARNQVKCDSNGTGISFKISLRMRWYDITGAVISDTSSSLVTLTTSYQAVSVSGTSPANAHSVRVGVFNESLVAPATRTVTYNDSQSAKVQSGKSCSIAIPSTANVGDQILVWVRLADKTLALNPNPVFTLVNSWTDGLGKTWLYRKTVLPQDIGHNFPWTTNVKTKIAMLTQSYSSVDQTTPVNVIGETSEATFRTAHTTPTVATTVAGCMIASAVFDVSTTTTAWAAPAGDNLRATVLTTGGKAVTGVCSDLLANGAGSYGGKVFTANVSSRYATMHTVALTPASGTGPGTVTVQAGAWELVEGSLTTWQQGGAWTSLFTGLADSWDETFAGDNVLTELQATDRQKILNTITIQSALYEEIRALGPVAYYKLDEADPGTTSAQQEAGNSADVIQPPLSQVAVGSGLGNGTGADPLMWGQGTGPGVDGTTALVFNAKDTGNGVGLRAILENPIYSGTELTLVQWYACSNQDNSTTHTIIKVSDSTQSTTNQVFCEIRGTPGSGGSIEANGFLRNEVTTYNADAVASGQFFDGATHCLAATFQLTGGQFVSTVYVDGAQKAQAVTACPISQFPTISIEGVGYAISSGHFSAGTFSHSVLYDYALDADSIAQLWTAGSTAFAGDTVDSRIARIAAWESQSALNLDQTTTVVDRHMPDAQTVLAAFQQAAYSENGTVYVDGSGDIRFMSRVNKERVNDPVLTLTADQVDASSFSKKTDDTLLANKAVVQRLSTSTKYTAINQESIDDHGTYEKDVDTILSGSQDATAYANYVMAFYGQPQPRCEAVTINALLVQQWDQIALIDMWELIEIQGLPATEQSQTLDLYIEGWEFDLDDVSWNVVFDTSTGIPFGIVSDPGRGITGNAVVGW
jgi:hypothetical protein